MSENVERIQVNRGIPIEDKEEALLRLRERILNAKNDTWDLGIMATLDDVIEWIDVERMTR